LPEKQSDRNRKQRPGQRDRQRPESGSPVTRRRWKGRAHSYKDAPNGDETLGVPAGMGSEAARTSSTITTSTATAASAITPGVGPLRHRASCSSRAGARSCIYLRRPPKPFVNGIPTPPPLPGPAWINKPNQEPAQIIS
jgi:hypothetical protein